LEEEKKMVLEVVNEGGVPVKGGKGSVEKGMVVDVGG
jgi:hypothetical protein